MFDFMRDRGTGGGDKNLEALGAYLDNALTPAERERLEGQLARDGNLRAELEQLRVMKLQLRSMPRRRVPRSFALNPDLYGRPKAQPLLQLYPVLRGATALAAFLLIFTVALGIFQGQFSAGGVAAPAPAEVAMFESAVEEAAAPAEESEQFALEEGATDREITPTEKAEELLAAPAIEAATEAPAEESAGEGDLAVATAPPPEGTLDAAGGRSTATSAPEGETLAQEAAPAAEPTVAVAETTSVTVAPTEAIADTTLVVAEEAESPAATTNSSFLLPLQIALGILFLLLLVLWLIARRRARSF
jgi:hypothetical protein